MDAITDAYDGDVRMINGTLMRVHHSAATLKKPPESMSWTKPGRSYYENPCSDQRAVRQRLRSSNTSTGSTTHEGATHIWAA
jgi:hypothetical protein